MMENGIYGDKGVMNYIPYRSSIPETFVMLNHL